jgi:hypothetical protein
MSIGERFYLVGRNAWGGRSNGWINSGYSSVGGGTERSFQAGLAKLSP